MTLRFAVVHEAEADFQTATELADRELLTAIDWLDEDLIGGQREWVGHCAATRLTWKNLKRLALDAGVTPMGHFGGETAFPDARAARRAIAFLITEVPDLNAIVLVRDQDDQPERRDGLQQARREDHSGLPVVIGVAVVEREAWVISGFDPAGEAEDASLGSVRKRVGFDPRTHSHELNACKDDNAPRSPKRALRELSGDNRDRERRCWSECALDVLRERGRENGLTAYMTEVRERLAPLIGHVPTS
jgi:hypothetical protein